jgi:hypothetical protein
VKITKPEKWEMIVHPEIGFEEFIATNVKVPDTSKP